jgi:hypothetical protein
MISVTVSTMRGTYRPQRCASRPIQPDQLKSLSHKVDIGAPKPRPERQTKRVGRPSLAVIYGLLVRNFADRDRGQTLPHPVG